MAIGRLRRQKLVVEVLEDRLAPASLNFLAANLESEIRIGGLYGSSLSDLGIHNDSDDFEIAWSPDSHEGTNPYSASIDGPFTDLLIYPDWWFGSDQREYYSASHEGSVSENSLTYENSSRIEATPEHAVRSLRASASGSGNLAYTIDPEAGENIGDPILIVFAPMEMIGGGTIGYGGQSFDNAFYFGSLSTENEVIVAAHIGDLINVSFGSPLDFELWSVDSSESLEKSFAVTLTKPTLVSLDLTISAATSFENKTVDVKYSFVSPDGQNAERDAALDLYWGTATGTRIGVPFHRTTLLISQQKTGTLPLPISIFAGRPAEATQVLFVAADPDDPVKSFMEERNINNFAYVNIFEDPTIDLVFKPGTKQAVSSHPGSLHEKEAFQVYAYIQNNALVPIEFTVNIDRVPLSPPAGLDLTPFDQTQTILVGALSVSEEEWFAGEKLDWDWIPNQNPMSLADLGKQVKEEVDEFFVDLIGDRIGGVGGAATKLYGFYDDYKDSVKPLIDGYSALKDYPEWVTETLNVKYEAHVTWSEGSEGQGEYLHTENVDVTVPQRRQDLLRMYFSTKALADVAVANAVGVGLDGLSEGKQPKLVLGTVALTGGMAWYVEAHLLYEAAKDPPDQNYTVFAVPEPVELTFPTGVGDGPFAAIIMANVQEMALRKVQSISRDRADGAREAEQPYWEEAQLRAASKFAHERATRLVPVGVFHRLFTPYYSAPDSTVPADAAQQLAQNGLPEALRSVLADYGFTEADANALTQGLIANGIQGTDPLTSWAMAYTGALEASLSAVAELEAATIVRTRELGAPVLSVPNDVLASFNDFQSQIDGAFSAGGFLPLDLFSTLTQFLDDVAAQVAATNDFAALKPHLDFGYGALLRYMRLDWTLAGIRERINTAEVNGSVSATLASSLDTALHAAEQALTVGQFATAAAHLDAAQSLVLYAQGGSNSNAVAIPLIGELSLAAGLLTNGKPRPVELATASLLLPGLTPGNIGDGSGGAQDVNFFRFTLSANDLASFGGYDHNGNNYSNGTTLRLYDVSGNDISGFLSYWGTYFSAQGGTFYVSVRGPVGPYDLSFAVQNLGGFDESEPNDTIADAQPVDLASGIPVTLNGFLGDRTAVGDDDVYAIIMQANTVLNVSVAAYDGLPFSGGGSIQALDELGNVVGENPAYSLPLHIYALAEKTVYVRYSERSDLKQAYHITFALGSAGRPPASLTVSANPPTVYPHELITISGSFTDTTQVDSHTVTIDWGDGSEPEILQTGRPPITFSFQGTVNLVGAGLGEVFALGQTISGSYSFDPVAPDGFATDATLGIYPIQSLSFTVGDGVYSGSASAGTGNAIWVFNGPNNDYSDEYSVVTLSTTGAAVGSLNLDRFRLDMSVRPPTAISSDVQILDPADLAGFTGRVLSIQFKDVIGNSFEVRATLDSLTKTPGTTTFAASHRYDVAGSYTASVKVTDDLGAQASETMAVTVAQANQPPILTDLPANQILEATSPSGAVATWTGPSASDPNEGPLTPVGSHSPGSTFALGDTLVSYIVTDSSGVSATATFTITVVDTTRPTFSSIPGNQTLGTTSTAGVVATWTAPSASDLVDTSLTITSTHSPGDTFAPGTTTVVYTATDDAGNETTASFTITVDAAPTATNAAFTLYQDDSVVTLRATDPETPAAELTFIIDSLPAKGRLLRNGSAVRIGDAFSGGPVALFYELPFAVGNVSTSFTFHARDARGQDSPTATVTIASPSASPTIAWVSGTAGNDVIVVEGVSNNVRVSNGLTVIGVAPLGAITEVRVFTLAGNDTLQMKNIVKAAVFDGGSSVDSVRIDGTTAADIFRLSANAVAFNAVNVSLNATERLTLAGGSGTDTLVGHNVASTWNIQDLNRGAWNGTTFFEAIENLTGGSAADSFVFANGKKVSGRIDGDAGGDTLNYSAYTTAVIVDIQKAITTGASSFAGIDSVVGGAGLDSLIGANTNNVWSLTSANIGTVGSVQFAAFEKLTGGSVSDTFQIGAGVSAWSGTVSGGAGIDTLLGANVVAVWNITNTGVGKFNSNLNFIAFENLTGGTADDSFVFAAGKKMSGRIDGGGGRNTLDYTAYTSALTINLQTGTATGTGPLPNGGVRNIAIVYGGRAADSITGDAGDNILIGNAGNDRLSGGGGDDVVLGGAGTDSVKGGDGRDLLVGGSGADTLGTANTTDPLDGDGDDILIGGMFAYFNEASAAVNLRALDALMAEWSRIDLPGDAHAQYSRRISHLLDPLDVGNNGSFRLDSSSLLSDGSAVDKLFGRAELDWFLVAGTDVVLDHENGEVSIVA